jgi:uroporphyrinogen-III decarboxylase
MTYRKKIQKLGNKIIERINNEKLTPLERFQKLRSFQEADRITGSLAFWSPSTVGVHNVSVEEYYSDAKKMYYCQLLALDAFGYDYPLLFADNYNTEPEALGAKIVFAGDDTPMIIEPAIKNKEELFNLETPNPYKDGRLPYRLEICQLHKEILGDFCPVFTSINAPFSMAAGVRGFTHLIDDIYDDPDFAHQLLGFCTEVTLSFGRAIKNVSGSYPALSDAWSSIPNISPDLFFEFSFPYAKRCILEFDQCGWSFGGGHQFSKDWKNSLRAILASGTKSFSLFQENITGIRDSIIVDLKKIKEICREHDVFLTTAVHPETMLEDSPDKIETLMKSWVSQVSSGGGHAFYASVLSGTPMKNVRAFVNTIRNAIYPLSNSHLST